MKKKNTGLIVSVIILSLLVIGLSGFIVYAKVLSNNEVENESKENQNNIIENNKEYQHNLTKRTNLQAIRNGYVEVIVDTEGNAYLTLIGNFNYEDNEYLKNNLLKLEKIFKKYSPKNYTSNSGEKTLNAYKLNVENVLTAYFVNMGNGGSSYFVFIKENGTLSYLSNDSIIHNGEINLKNISNLNNIVSIVENTYTLTPYAIDLNGNEISLYDYIKQ